MAIENYYYPQDINNDEFAFRRVIFMAVTGKDITQNREYIYEKYKKNPKDFESQVKGIVTLPLNSNISDSQSHSWSESSYFDAIAESAEGIVNTFTKKGSLAGKSTGDFISNIQKISDAKVIGAVSDMIGVRRPLLNPGYFQNYSKSSLRSFSFSFTFVPENKEESKQIIDIVRFFKRCSSPSRMLNSNFPIYTALSENFGTLGTAIGTVGPLGALDGTLTALGNLVMLSPMTWEIYVCNDNIRNLMSFTRCVCTNVSVTYGESEKVAMFEDGMPKEIKLSLSFSEGQLQFADAYGEKDNFGEVVSDIAKKLKANFDNMTEAFMQGAKDIAGQVIEAGNNVAIEAGSTIQSTVSTGLDYVDTTGSLSSAYNSTVNYWSNQIGDLFKTDSAETAQSKLPTPEPQKSEDKASGYRVWEK